VPAGASMLIHATPSADPRHERARQARALRHRREASLFVSVRKR
jgi:hypothetical protein